MLVYFFETFIRTRTCGYFGPTRHSGRLPFKNTSKSRGDNESIRVRIVVRESISSYTRTESRL